MREMWSLENLHICNCDALQELPARIDALAALHALELEYLETFQKPNTLSFFHSKAYRVNLTSPNIGSQMYPSWSRSQTCTC